MNYKAELRGFALDRVIRLAEVNKESISIADLTKAADSVVDYLYIVDKDIKSHLDTLIPLFVQARDVEKLENLILELQQIKAEMEAGVK